jgi:hypothetical protein
LMDIMDEKKILPLPETIAGRQPLCWQWRRSPYTNCAAVTV